MSHRPWTDEEIGFLQDSCDAPARQVAEELGRTVKAIYDARRGLRIGTFGLSIKAPWTADEDEVIRSAAPTESAAHLTARLPGRTADAIQARRGVLGVKVRDARPSEVAGRPLVAKTCLSCGLLLAGSWFTAVKSKGYIAWSSYCRQCASRKSGDWEKSNRDRDRDQGRSWVAHLRDLTAEKATRNGQPYTEEDYRVLADVSLTDLQKALRLGRTHAAVSSARQRAGLKSKPDGLGDPTRDVWVIDNPNLEGAA